MIKISPSILSANFVRLEEELKRIPDADMIHVDVMDGRFVPNITIGQPVVKCLRSVTDKVLDVHLMIERPEAHIEEFFRSGADILTVHAEASVHLHRLLQTIRGFGIKAGVALNPSTPVCAIENVLDCTDMILVMTVNPGFGGQKFIDGMIGKIQKVKSMVKMSGRDIDIQVDGGVNTSTAVSCVRAGANVLVAGNAVFGSSDPNEAIAEIRRAVLPRI